MLSHTFYWTAIEFHPHWYMTMPGSWSKADVFCFDGRVKAVIHNAVRVCVSTKILNSLSKEMHRLLSTNQNSIHLVTNRLVGEKVKTFIAVCKWSDHFKKHSTIISKRPLPFLVATSKLLFVRFLSLSPRGLVFVLSRRILWPLLQTEASFSRLELLWISQS